MLTKNKRSEFVHGNKRKAADWKKWLFYGCLIVLPLAQFLLMYVYVNFNSFVMAFSNYDDNTQRWVWAGFTHFKDLFYDIGRLPALKYGFKNSFSVWLIDIFVTVPLGIIFAYYIYKKFPASKLFRIMLFLPSILSANLLMIIFKYYADAFLPKVINQIFGTKLFGLLSVPKTTFPTLLIFNVFLGFGVSVLMYTGAMSNISESVTEAAELDGVNTLQELIFIVLPQMVGTISVFIITGIAGMFTNQLNLWSIYHVTADFSIQTIGYYLYCNIFKAGSSFSLYPYNAALGVLITLIIVPVILGARKLIKKIDPMED